MRAAYILVLIGVLLIRSVCAGEVVRTIPPQSEYDASHSYFIDLLNAALNRTVPEYGVANVEYSTLMQQGRALHELAKGTNIDVYWAGTTLARERQLLAIRVPLVKGLLGFRMGIINGANKQKFGRIKNKQQLATQVACQGKHWPDSDILEAAGLKVQRSAVYESMFKQVQVGRCDYFPRGVHEGRAEVLARRSLYPELMLFSDLIIYYPFPMYFFVSRSNPKLKQRLTLGLERLIDSGYFDLHLKQHEVTQHLFPLAKWRDSTRVIKLENPQLPEDTRISDVRYWIQPF